MVSFRVVAAALAASIALSACSNDDEKGRARPVAAAGDDRTAGKGATVLLDGSASSDPLGEALAFEWSQLGGPAVANVASAASALTPVTLPHASGTYRFQLVVSAGGARSLPDVVEVHVQNTAPVANAGPDRSVRAGWVVGLDGAYSADADLDPLTFVWTQTSGTPVVLEAFEGGRARFVAPAEAGPLGFRLVASDGEAASQDDVTITVFPPGVNLPPTADAGLDQTVPRSARVLLPASAGDPDGGVVTFSWEQLSGPTVTLLTSTWTPWAEFTAPAADADIELRLSVSDGQESVSDVVLVHVRNQAPVLGTVRIVPDLPGTAADLTASASASDPDGDPVTVSWSWRRNGVALPGFVAAALPASETARGDVIEVLVTASDGTLSATGSATATIVDSPPVLTLVAPAEVAWGEPIDARFTVEDPDGDPLPPSSVALLYGPYGMTIATDGTVAWTPALPMFGRALDVSFGASLASDPATSVRATVRVVDAARPDAFRRAATGVPGGAAGLRARDLDGDGDLELLVAGAAGGISELARTGDGYATAWVLPFAAGEVGSSYDRDFTAAADAADLDGDGAAEIVYGMGQDLVLLGGSSRREQARYLGASGDRWHAVTLADADGDGDAEVVALSGDSSYYGTTGRLVVLDAGTMGLEWTSPTLALGRGLRGRGAGRRRVALAGALRPGAAECGDVVRAAGRDVDAPRVRDVDVAVPDALRTSRVRRAGSPRSPREEPRPDAPGARALRGLAHHAAVPALVHDTRPAGARARVAQHDAAAEAARR